MGMEWVMAEWENYGEDCKWNNMKINFDLISALNFVMKHTETMSHLSRLNISFLLFIIKLLHVIYLRLLIQNHCIDKTRLRINI